MDLIINFLAKWYGACPECTKTALDVSKVILPLTAGIGGVIAIINRTVKFFKEGRIHHPESQSKRMRK